jgi:pseudouridine-5'-phosphate glycosidase
MIDKLHFNLSSEVQSALSAEKPVVAFESTVIAHGLPAPQNLNTAQRVEQIVREADVTPATIAILGGELSVGLDQQQLELVANGKQIEKVTTRDLPIAIAKKWNGATTVASTIWIAHRAGIKVLVTGGIGGVHPGALPDVSADLPALAATPIIVVCSGAKIVLDLPATREWLETYGVTVLGYGCDEMPAFYSRKSGLPVDAVVNSPGEVAQFFRAQQNLGLERALLVTVPVPEQHEVPADDMKRFLDAAHHETKRKGVSGHRLTPFLLSHMSKASEGATLAANIALLENNACVAAQIAKALG